MAAEVVVLNEVVFVVYVVGTDDVVDEAVVDVAVVECGCCCHL